MRITNRWKIIIAVILFNILFEISLRGFSLFLKNLALLPFFFLVYLLWFVAIEDVIGRYRLRDYHFMIFVLAIWLLPQVLFLRPDGTYMVNPPFVLGINWPEFLFLVFAWWFRIGAIRVLS